MTFGEQMVRLNEWYDRLPENWRFQFWLWPLVALGAFNILLSLAGFPFGLLVILGSLCLVAIRVPYVLGWWRVPEHAAGRPAAPAQAGLEMPDWIVEMNQRYDAMPEERRFWVIPIILLVAGLLNMLLTLGAGFPFGLLFLIVLLIVLAVRAPYATGMVRVTEAQARAPAVAHHYAPSLTHAPDLGAPLYSHFAEPEPAHLSTAEPLHHQVPPEMAAGAEAEPEEEPGLHEDHPSVTDYWPDRAGNPPRDE